MAEWVWPVLFVCVCVCLYVQLKIDGGDSEGGRKWVRTCSILLSGFSSSGVKITSSLSKPYPPSWPGNTYTHYSTQRDYISIHIKLIAMLHCRLRHKHKSSADSTHSTDTHTHTHTHALTHKHNKILHTPRCSGSYLFPVVLRHRSDSSAACFTVTVVLFSVYKFSSPCSRNIWFAIT